MLLAGCRVNSSASRSIRARRRGLAIIAASVPGLVIAAAPNREALGAQSPSSRSLVAATERRFDGTRVQEQTEVAVVDGVIGTVGAEARKRRDLPAQLTPADIQQPSRAPDPTGAVNNGVTTPTPHIRTDDALLRWLLETGSKNSSTFQSLTRRLEESDLFVYLRIVPMPRGIAGKIAFMTAAGGVRYVQVMLRDPEEGVAALVMLAHELQHALEVAHDPLIVDTESMAAQYLRHGAARMRGTTILVDTVDAMLAGNAVARELQGRYAELNWDFARFRAAVRQAVVENQAPQVGP